MTWREYHEATKHSVESLRRARHVLDWANMPDPFRHYEGVPVFDLPADPPAREIRALDVLQGTFGSTSVGDGPAFLSQLLFYSVAISASKLVPSTGYKYALRVNPSSGNLHPTVKDPVCGMETETATAAGHTDHAGQKYYFCGSKCKEKFDNNPAQYLGKSAAAPKSGSGCCS